MNRDAWIGLVALVVVVSLGYQGLQLIGIIDEEGEAFERTCEQYGGHVTQTDVTCEITYSGESYTVPVENLQHTFDEEQARENREDCVRGERYAKRDPQTVPVRQTVKIDRFTYHDDTGVCEVEEDAITAQGEYQQPKRDRKPKPSPAEDCEQGYSPCVPLFPPDLNCDDVGP